MLLKLEPNFAETETSDGWWFYPVVHFRLSNRKILIYECGNGKLFRDQNIAFQRAERFISLFNKLMDMGPPKKPPFYMCNCTLPGCPCKGDCNEIAVREVEYPDKHQQLFWLCENCLHEFFCGFPELEEEVEP